MDEVTNKKNLDFFSSYTVKVANPNTILIDADQVLKNVIWLESGRVCCYDIGKNGSKTILTIFKKGSFFPVSAVIGKNPNHYFFETMEESCYRLAPTQDVLTFLNQNPDVMLDLLKRVYRGMDGLLARLALAHADTLLRLVNEIYIECLRFGIANQSRSLKLKITHAELAERAGLSRETVSRLLSRLQKEGVVKTGHRLLVVPDINSLTAILSVA